MEAHNLANKPSKFNLSMALLAIILEPRDVSGAHRQKE